MPEEIQPETPPVVEQPAQAAETDWKTEARKWEQRAKDNAAKLKEAEPRLSEYDRLVAASKTELERATEEATRWQTEAQKWRGTSVSSRIEALASSDFADTSDAVAALGSDPDRFLGADGVLNDEAIRSELQAVLEKKPHWRKPETPTTPRVPAPNRAQGSGNNGRAATDPAQEFAAIIQGQVRGL